jgi:hypothetical protein
MQNQYSCVYSHSSLSFTGFNLHELLCYVELEATDEIGTMFTGFTAQVTARMVREVFRNASLRSLVGHSWGKNIDGDVFAGGVSINGTLISAPPFIIR